jgi:hypothetical protein
MIAMIRMFTNCPLSTAGVNKQPQYHFKLWKKPAPVSHSIPGPPASNRVKIVPFLNSWLRYIPPKARPIHFDPVLSAWACPPRSCRTWRILSPSFLENFAAASRRRCNVSRKYSSG